MIWLLFFLIQIISLILFPVGVLALIPIAFLRLWTERQSCQYQKKVFAWRGGKATFIFSNEEDGIFPAGYLITGTWRDSWHAYVWAAWRNSINNLRFVPGVSLKGRPFWRKTWGPKPGGWYAQFGWNGSGWPVLSAGRNVNPW